MSVSNELNTDQRRALAYERLNLTPEQVRAVAQVTPVLKKSKISISQAADYLRGAEGPEARAWVQKYEELPAYEARLLPFEAFCLAARIPARKMFEILSGAVFEQSANAGQLIRAAAHPGVVAEVVKTAKTDKGTAEKKMLLQASGMLPVGSKTVVFGPQTNIQGDQNNSQQTVVVAPAEDTVRRIQSRFGQVHVLPPAAVRELPENPPSGDAA